MKTRYTDFAYETPADQGGGPALGTVGDGGGNGSEPAGALNADNEPGTPDAVPYSRFKEVNDAARPYRELEQSYGVDADSVRQLLEWERGFAADPSNTWLTIGEQYLDELPEPVAAAIRQARGTTDDQPKTGAADNSSQDEAPPKWFTDFKEKEFEPTKQTLSQREEREAEDARQALLDSMLDDFKAADEKDGIVWATGDKAEEQAKALRLRYIRLAALDTQRVEDILPAARQEALAFRDGVLTQAVDTGRRTTAPLTVPSGGPSGGANVPEPPKTLAQATKLAAADIAAQAAKGG